jgi:hypothetical protein
MANIDEAGVRKRKTRNSQCINQIGFCENHNTLIIGYLIFARCVGIADVA